VTVGSSGRIDRNFRISANGSLRGGDARTPDVETPKCRKDLRRRSGRSLTVGLPWNGRGHMGVHHMPVSREDKREWWDAMTSPKVTWTLLNVPRATVIKGDSYTVGPVSKVNRNFEIRELE
jgi:hypothetical protein